MNIIKKNEASDRRENYRYYVPEGEFFVVKCKTGEKLGTLLEISRGGLSFRYLPNGEPLSESFELDIVFRENNVWLSQIPYENISDFEMDSDCYFNTKIARRRGLKFIELTEQHISKIDQLVTTSYHYSFRDYIPPS